MADFCDDFENWIQTRTPITNLIGIGNVCRVYPDVPNQGIPLPFLVYAEAGGESVETLAGGAGICQSVVHTWAFGATRRKANELAEILKQELRPYKGTMGGVHVSEVSCSSHRDWGVDQPSDKQPQPRYWTRRIYDIWYTETT